MARCSNRSSNTLTLGKKHQKSIKDALLDVEYRIHEWLYGSKQAHNWKFYKTATNEHLNINCDANDPINNITIRSLDDISNKKCKVWRAMAYLPCLTPQRAIEFYTVPQYHLEYDDLNTINTMHKFSLEMHSKGHTAEYDINVAITNPKFNGLISPRLSVNLGCSKYSDKMETYCCLGRFMTQAMMRQLAHQLHITADDIKQTVSKTLNLYWGAKLVTVEAENGETISVTEITYVLQIDNGGWIPQWAVEMGLIDQHMIAIFRQITKKINSIQTPKREIQVIAPVPVHVPSSDDEQSETTDTKSNISEYKERENTIGDWVNLSPLLSVTTESSTCDNICNEMEELQVVTLHGDNDDDDLLSDGVYVDDAETLTHTHCLVDERNECCIM